jgi:hypothetical protein
MDEVDHEARLLVEGAAGHASYPLLVDAARRRRGEVHADRRPGGVPTLGEEHRVAEHVNLAALEGGQDLRQLALRRLAGDRARVHPGRLKCGGDVIRVPNPRRVDDAGDPAEARSIQVRDGDVERLLVQQLGELFLVEVLVDLAPPQRHLGDRAHARAGRDADAAQRRDHPAARGLGQVEARGLGGEEIGDVSRDQRASRGHADEHGLRPAADAGARLLAQRRVRFVADHDRVRVRDPARVSDEPLVGLDGDRAVGMIRAVEERRGESVLVAAIGDLADELVDEISAVGEDEDTAGPRPLHESERGNGLAGARGVLEPKTPAGPRILGRLRNDLGRGLLPVLRLLVRGQGLVLGDLLGPSIWPLSVGPQLRDGAPAVTRELGVGAAGAVRALGHRVLDLGGQRGQRPREHVHLVLGELGSVGEPDRLAGEQPLEAEKQRVAPAPLGRGRLATRLELGQGGIDGAATRRPGREALCGLAFEQDRFARELAQALELIACDRPCRARSDFD